MYEVTELVLKCGIPVLVVIVGSYWKLHSKVTTLYTRMDAISEATARVEKHIVGNGQPGLTERTIQNTQAIQGLQQTINRIDRVGCGAKAIEKA